MIKIEVTGNSVAEVADKLLAIGASLRATPVATAVGAPSPLRGNAAAVVGIPADSAFQPEEIVYVPDVVVGPAPEVAEAAPAPEPAPSAEAPEPSTTAATDTPAPSADTLRELVLAVVAAKGRDVMVELLSRFGVGKATEVPAEQQAELVGALQDLLA